MYTNLLPLLFHVVPYNQPTNQHLPLLLPSLPLYRKALILVGGFGTRLRPLTLTVPKPLVDFANKPMVYHQIKALAKAGVDEVILAINYQPELMEEELAKIAEEVGIEITCSREEEPLGTAGPIALVKDKLNDGDPFFVLNSDVTCEFPFADLITFHNNHGKEGTIMVTKVQDPSKYGVVVSKEDGQIERFVEKPKIFVGDRINAGIYIFSPAILDRISPKPTSIETEIFPAMAEDGELYCMDLEGYWMDVGQPPDYLKGMRMYLGSGNEDLTLAEGDNISGNVLIDESAVIGNNCLIGPDVVIGANVVIGDGVRITGSTIMQGAKVGASSIIQDSIVGWESSVGRWVRLEDVCVLGEDVAINDELYITGTRVLPHKSIKDSIKESTIIM